jgi:hypothetical protein
MLVALAASRMTYRNTRSKDPRGLTLSSALRASMRA